MVDDPNDELLLGYKEIAERSGVGVATLRNYRRRGYLPEPDVMLADRPRWRASTIQNWMRLRSLGANTSRHL